MSHVDALEATLDRLIDEAATLEDAARIVVKRARMGLDTTWAIAALGAVLDRLDSGEGKGEGA